MKHELTNEAKNSQKTGLYQVVGRDDLNGSVFSVCSSKAAAEEAVKLLSEKCAIREESLEIVPGLSLNTVEIDGKEIKVGTVSRADNIRMMAESESLEAKTQALLELLEDLKEQLAEYARSLADEREREAEYEEDCFADACGDALNMEQEAEEER